MNRSLKLRAASKRRLQRKREEAAAVGAAMLIPGTGRDELENVSPVVTRRTPPVISKLTREPGARNDSVTLVFTLMSGSYNPNGTILRLLTYRTVR